MGMQYRNKEKLQPEAGKVKQRFTSEEKIIGQRTYVKLQQKHEQKVRQQNLSEMTFEKTRESKGKNMSKITIDKTRGSMEKELV